MIFNHIGGRNEFFALVPYVLFVPFLLLGSQSSAHKPTLADPTQVSVSNSPNDTIEPTDNGQSSPVVVSPNGRYVAVYLNRGTASHVDSESDELDYDTPGYVYVLDRQTLTATLLDPFWRSASMKWSPEGGRLAFNDHEGSNSIRCYVYSFSVEDDKLTYRQTDVSDLFMNMGQSKVLRRMIHQYVFGTRWVDDNTLIIEVSGHAAPDHHEPDWIEWHFQFDLITETFTDVTDSESSRHTNERAHEPETESK
jgi:hypothetical protein